MAPSAPSLSPSSTVESTTLSSATAALSSVVPPPSAPSSTSVNVEPSTTKTGAKSSSATLPAPSSVVSETMTAQSSPTAPLKQSSTVSASAPPALEASSSAQASTSPLFSQAPLTSSSAGLPSPAIITSSAAPLPTDPATAPTDLSSSPTRTRVTESWLPTHIIAEDSTTTNTNTASQTQAVTSSLPKAIIPTQSVSQSSGFELITIGFKQALNYAFIVENSLSSAQIFEYLPQVLCFPFPEIDESAVIVKKLVPYSSTQVDYIITVAEVYFNQSYVDLLQNEILDLTSKIYNNSDATEKSMALLIDSKIPVTNLLESLDNPQQQNSNSNNGNEPNGGGDPAVDSLGSIDSAAITASTIPSDRSRNHKYIAGVVVGCVAGVGIYLGVIIFFLKRRIRNAAEQDVPDTSFSSMSDESLDSAGAPYTREKLEYSSSVGDIGLPDAENSNTQSSSFLQMFGFTKPKEDQPRFVPEISAPINVKSSLGW